MECSRQFKIIFMPICHLLMNLLLISQQVHVKLSIINTLLHERVKEWVKIDFWGNSEEPACIISVQIALLWQHPQGSANSSSRQNPASFTLFFFFVFFLSKRPTFLLLYTACHPLKILTETKYENVKEGHKKKYHKSVQLRDVLDRSRERKNKQEENGRGEKDKCFHPYPSCFPMEGQVLICWTDIYSEFSPPIMNMNKYCTTLYIN